MTKATLIKICGIKDSQTAKFCVDLGANFLGMVFHKPSPRFISLETAKEIVKSIQSSSIIPVAVFVDATAGEMQNVCEILGVNHVQLHGDVSKKEHIKLPEAIT